MYKLLLRQLKLVSNISIFAIKVKFLKIYQKYFFTTKAPFVLKIIKFLYFPLPLFIPFLAIADFYICP